MSGGLAARTDVVVDLGELTFADSSLMLDLAIVARRLRMAGRRLHLRNAPPQGWRGIGGGAGTCAPPSHKCGGSSRSSASTACPASSSTRTRPSPPSHLVDPCGRRPRGDPRGEPVERLVELLRDLAPAEQPDDEPAQRRSRHLLGAQAQAARAVAVGSARSTVMTTMPRYRSKREQFDK